MKETLPSSAHAVSLIKGFHSGSDGSFKLISDLIQQTLDIDYSVLMGANIADEIAKDLFCESTLGEMEKEK